MGARSGSLGGSERSLTLAVVQPLTRSAVQA
jgi:hypothetical protein